MELIAFLTINVKLMVKVSKHFEVSIPFNKMETGADFVRRLAHLCDATVSGVAYKYSNEEPENTYDYDIDELYVGNERVPLVVFEVLGVELKENDSIHRAVMSHIIKMFYVENVSTIIHHPTSDPLVQLGEYFIPHIS